ncbi:DUF2281 domain-containing protein [Thermococcus sp. MAR1]|uniref:DUF2281 domain-containing protein n=1 Tax=Thermococcus sp. MAR1 TaxID=1638263 RepID=UPI00143CB911|nr:DUF2281 domain-containing protein [Thermococcus sp. MAR1]NJE10322.1 DUF2281 domain-containing protein [Thermococcus sp. MAR1]
MEEVERIFAKLPPEARRELLDYAEFLLQKYGKREARGFKFTWEGKLKGVKMTSVELQHKASEWREDVSG